ncbi:MAG: hypothetical protein JJU03_07140 [Idiomarina sp.]|nr:hypothetical protein [Idiomarina sp.]
MAFPDGPEPGYTGGQGYADCSSCHFAGPDKSAASRIELYGLAEQMVADETYELTLLVSDPEQRLGGFQLAIRDLATGESVGELKVGDNQQISSYQGVDFLSHSEPQQAQPEEGEQVTRWKFQWRAANANDIEISAAAVAADGDDSSLGDNVYTISRIIQTN